MNVEASLSRDHLDFLDVVEDFTTEALVPDCNYSLPMSALSA
jgi:hypothetical protein